MDQGPPEKTNEVEGPKRVADEANVIADVNNVVKPVSNQNETQTSGMSREIRSTKNKMPCRFTNFIITKWQLLF